MIRFVVLCRWAETRCAAIFAPWRRDCITGVATFGPSVTSGVRSTPPSTRHTQSSDRHLPSAAGGAETAGEKYLLAPLVHQFAAYERTVAPKVAAAASSGTLKPLGWGRLPPRVELEPAPTTTKQEPHGKACHNTGEARVARRQRRRLELGGHQGGRATGAQTLRWWCATQSS